MIKGSNKYEKIAESLYGLYTLETLAERLKINKVKAVYVIHRLRKLGLVKTIYGAGNKPGHFGCPHGDRIKSHPCCSNKIAYQKHICTIV